MVSASLHWRTLYPRLYCSLLIGSITLLYLFVADVQYLLYGWLPVQAV